MAAPQVDRTIPDAPETRLAELARAGGPLRRVVAALAGRLVQSKHSKRSEHPKHPNGWERLGYARLGDYARERLGLSARSLQEFAQVDGKLRELPRLEAALVSGRLPWSVVRLLARFVTADDEGGWIERSRGASVRSLERALRAVERGGLEAGGLPGTRVSADSPPTDEEGQDAAPSERVRLLAPAALCFKWQRTREFAAKVAGERITPGAALEMLTAEVLSALPLAPGTAEVDDLPRPEDEAAVGPHSTGESDCDSGCGCDRSDGGGGGGGDGDGFGFGAANVCATQRDGAAGPSAGPDPTHLELPTFLAPLLEDLEHADPFELDRRLRRAVRLEQRLDSEVGSLLRHVTASEYDWRCRFHSLGAYAREHLGMSPRKARALLRLERVGDVCPALRAAYRDGSLSWVQALALAPLLTFDSEGGWRERWVAWAQRVTVRRLEEVVDRALVMRDADPGAWPACQDDPERAVRTLFGDEAPTLSLDEAAARGSGTAPGERQTCARPRDPLNAIPLRITAPRDVARLFRAALCTVRRALEAETGQLPSEAEGFDAMIDHALRSWGVDDLWLERRSRKKFAVFERDDWRCTVPGCSSRRNLQAHHIVFRSAGGGDEDENLATLCAFHHLRGVHAGTIRVTGRAPAALSFELGVRPQRPPLARYHSGDRLA